eukprot:scaffold656_cov146-Skeletonema_menzelii.AAC.2
MSSAIDRSFSSYGPFLPNSTHTRHATKHLRANMMNSVHQVITNFTTLYVGKPLCSGGNEWASFKFKLLFHRFKGLALTSERGVFVSSPEFENSMDGSGVYISTLVVMLLHLMDLSHFT